MILIRIRFASVWAKKNSNCNIWTYTVNDKRWIFLPMNSCINMTPNTEYISRAMYKTIHSFRHTYSSCKHTLHFTHVPWTANGMCMCRMVVSWSTLETIFCIKHTTLFVCQMLWMYRGCRRMLYAINSYASTFSRLLYTSLYVCLWKICCLAFCEIIPVTLSIWSVCRQYHCEIHSHHDNDFEWLGHILCIVALSCILFFWRVSHLLVFKIHIWNFNSYRFEQMKAFYNVYLQLNRKIDSINKMLKCLHTILFTIIGLKWIIIQITNKVRKLSIKPKQNMRKLIAWEFVLLFLRHWNAFGLFNFSNSSIQFDGRLPANVDK